MEEKETKHQFYLDNLPFVSKVTFGERYIELHNTRLLDRWLKGKVSYEYVYNNIKVEALID